MVFARHGAADARENVGGAGPRTGGKRDRHAAAEHVVEIGLFRIQIERGHAAAGEDVVRDALE